MPPSPQIASNHRGSTEQISPTNPRSYPVVCFFRARKKQTTGYDLGFVGEICSVEPRWLEAIWGEGGIPVLSSLALGSDGEYYNVNADQMAAACAAACHADALIFLTDVPGVKDAEGSVIPWLKTKEMAALISASVISGGMLPKLEACT